MVDMALLSAVMAAGDDDFDLSGWTETEFAAAQGLLRDRYGEPGWHADR